MQVKAAGTDDAALNLIISISTLLVRRGSPGTTRNFDEQPELEIPITPVLPPKVALLKSKPPARVPVEWQPPHVGVNMACMPVATLLSEPATPKTAVAGVPDAFCTVTTT